MPAGRQAGRHIYLLFKLLPELEEVLNNLWLLVVRREGRGGEGREGGERGESA